MASLEFVHSDQKLRVDSIEKKFIAITDPRIHTIQDLSLTPISQFFYSQGGYQCQLLEKLSHA